MVNIYYCPQCGIFRTIKNGVAVPSCDRCHKNFSTVTMTDTEYSLYQKEIEEKGIMTFLQDHNINPFHTWPMRTYDLSSEEHNGI